MGPGVSQRDSFVTQGEKHMLPGRVAGVQFGIGVNFQVNVSQNIPLQLYHCHSHTPDSSLIILYYNKTCIFGYILIWELQSDVVTPSAN